MFKAHLCSNSSRSNNTSDQTNSSSTHEDNNNLYNPIVARNHKKLHNKSLQKDTTRSHLEVDTILQTRNYVLLRKANKELLKLCMILI